MLRIVVVMFALAVAAPALAAQDYVYDPTRSHYDPDYLGTYSIIVRDPETGELGIGVASRVLAVGRNGSTFRGSSSRCARPSVAPHPKPRTART